MSESNLPAGFIIVQIHERSGPHIRIQVSFLTAGGLQISGVDKCFGECDTESDVIAATYDGLDTH